MERIVGLDPNQLFLKTIPHDPLALARLLCDEFTVVRLRMENMARIKKATYENCLEYQRAKLEMNNAVAANRRMIVRVI
jgi:hypothetical protein